MNTETPDHINRIPPSMAIARYLHDHADAISIELVGPMYDGEAQFTAPTLFVDGGTIFRGQHEGLSVGDGDSFSGSLDECLNPHKDYSDLAYVLASLPTHFHKVTLSGFLGGRRDHELANLGEASCFLKHRHQATRIQFGMAICGFSPGDWQLEIHEPFSLMCLETAKLTLTGDCAYQLTEQTQIGLLCSHGLSNTGTGSITLKTDAPVFIIYSDRKA